MPTRMESIQMLDDGMQYLQNNPFLEREVGRALVQVINDRAVDPLAQMAEFLGGGAKAATSHDLEHVKSLQQQVDELKQD